MLNYLISVFIFLILPICEFGQCFDCQLQFTEKNQQHTNEEPLYCVVEAPLSMQQLWENAAEHFLHRENVKLNDNRWFSKWYQLSKLWSKNKNEAGHYERKESIIITSDDTDLEMMKTCRADMGVFCVEYLRNIELKYNLPEHLLTMENAVKPTHTLRLLHYLPNANATAHCDTSIMTCLYYRDSGLQLKVNGKWMEAPVLKPNEMLLMYGVPGEIISNGHLKAGRHRVECDERYAVAYFHSTPKEYVLSSENYNSTTMAHVYQEAQLWYADVNARVVRNYCKSTELPWYAVLYGWLAKWWTPVNEHPVSYKEIAADSKEQVI